MMPAIAGPVLPTLSVVTSAGAGMVCPMGVLSMVPPVIVGVVMVGEVMVAELSVGELSVGDVARTALPVPVTPVTCTPLSSSEFPAPATGSQVLFVNVSVVAAPTRTSAAPALFENLKRWAPSAHNRSYPATPVGATPCSGNRMDPPAQLSRSLLFLDRH